jgi:inhibitor of cysteine peptidase
MFTKFTLTIVTLLVLVSLVGCGARNATPTASSTTESNPEPSSTEGDSADNYQMLPLISGKVANVTLDANADGTTQQLKVGEVMAITLESNISTGYSWSASISDPAVLVQMGESQYQEPATPMPGAAGKQIFFFQAAAPGTTTLTLNYQRPFETNVAPEKTVTINVEVK